MNIKELALRKKSKKIGKYIFKNFLHFTFTSFKQLSIYSTKLKINLE